MNEECIGCMWYYEERENNWRTCNHAEYDIEKDICPGRFSKADLKLTPEERKGEK